MTARLPGEPTCRQIVELVTDYLEGRMTIEDRTRFEHHLVFCEGCRVYLEQMRQTIRASRAVSEESFSPDSREELVRLFRGWKDKK